MDIKCVISDHDYCEVKTRQKIIIRKKIKSSDVTLRVGAPVSDTVHTYLTIGYEDSESNNVKLKQFVVKGIMFCQCKIFFFQISLSLRTLYYN